MLDSWARFEDERERERASEDAEVLFSQPFAFHQTSYRVRCAEMPSIHSFIFIFIFAKRIRVAYRPRIIITITAHSRGGSK